MNLSMQLPLRTTIPMTAVAITALACCVSTPASLEIGRVAAYESAHGDSRLFVRQASALVEMAWKEGRIDRIRGLLSAFRENVSVTAASLFAPDDRVIDWWGQGQPPTSWAEATASWPAGIASDLRTRAQESQSVQSFVDEQGRRILVVQAVWATDPSLSNRGPHLLAMDYDVRKGLDEVFAASVLALGIFFSLVFTLAIAAGSTLRWLLRRRSQAVLRAARDIAHGDFDARVGRSADDEFGAIATAIDDMAARLAETRDRNRQSEERYRILFEEAEDAVLLCDDGGTVMDANHAAAALFGRALEKVRGVTLDRLVTLEPNVAMNVHLRAESQTAVRADAHTAEGGCVPVELHVRPLLGLGRLALFRDLRRELEAAQMRDALVMQERLAALGRLAAGIGHELNNPLSYVLGNLELIASELQKSPSKEGSARHVDLTSLVRDARDGATRMKRIVGELHVFTRAARDNTAGSLHASSVDVENEVDAALHLAARVVEGRARVEKQVDPGLPHVRGEEGRLAQVLVNLLTNAAQSMPPGRSESQNVIGVRTTTLDDGKTVAIDVIDNGSGIDADVLPHLFAPFFTTRASHGGSGLGLSVSRELVLSMGGSLDVQSASDKGCVFRVRLPGLPQGTAANVTTPPTPVGRDVAARSADVAGARVLIVDDDPLVARVLSLMLSDASVTVATSVGDAIDAARRSDFDCILCDLIMPDGGGEAVIRGLQVHDERILERVVFMTAGIPSQELTAFVASSGRTVLEKPIDAVTLFTVVAEQMGQRARTGPREQDKDDDLRRRALNP